jgi:hypothetical protein
MAIASVCPPGSYRSTIAEDGIPCVACPQGYWSKNYGLRERGECIICPPGDNHTTTTHFYNSTLSTIAAANDPTQRSAKFATDMSPFSCTDNTTYIPAINAAILSTKRLANESTN